MRRGRVLAARKDDMDIGEKLDEAIAALEDIGRDEFSSLIVEVKTELLRLKRKNKLLMRDDEVWEERVKVLIGRTHDLERMVESSTKCRKRDNDSSMTGVMMMQDGMVKELLCEISQACDMKWLADKLTVIFRKIDEREANHVSFANELKERAQVAEERLAELTNNDGEQVPF